ncbi:Dcm Site-specific DNA methylase [Caulobacteraceae bacterium]
MSKVFQVVDLFAGPGGLAEGFSSFEAEGDHSPFKVVVSIEKEASAFRTLRLRSFLRQFEADYPPEYHAFMNDGGDQPDWNAKYPEQWKSACREALHLELGTEAADAVVKNRMAILKASGAPTVVIGGPPCQAYSLAGRVRNQGKADYVPEDDHRHFLYQQYINILGLIRPSAFVMENVKGMLSSSVDGGRIFDRVLTDLRCAGAEPDSYRLFAIGRSAGGAMMLQPAGSHADYIVRSETFGVPQARHRVIIVGIRRDLADNVAKVQEWGRIRPENATVKHVLEGLPKLRSGLNKDDGPDAWIGAVLKQMQRVCAALSDGGDASAKVQPVAEEAMSRFAAQAKSLRRESRAAARPPADCPTDLSVFLSDPRLTATLNHAARGHMEDDLGRYFFAAVFGQAMGRTPKSDDFPAALAPVHANWESGKFADRFRVQGWDKFGTTVTSHISKDGHYYIHPDPLQCRSLTVREAARLQTFPDNYVFLGNRTQQYVQVGNAVPPYLARQIADALWRVLEVAD